jgi:CRP/FNR family cyclic AMP-dependent transcriptional regulator
MNADARDRIDQLRTLPLFRHLPEGKIEELTRVLTVQAVPAGHLVFEEGSPGDAMFLLAVGEVRIEKQLEAGGFAELARLAPGDVFGEMALIERLPRSARAVAHTDITMFALERQELERWLASEPMAAMGLFVELLRVLSHRLRRSSRQLVLLHDVGDLAVRRFPDEAGFLGAVLHRMIPHLEGEWSAAAYLYNEFNDEVVRVDTVGPHPERLPATIPLAEGASRWMDDHAFSVPLAGEADAPIGFLVARNELVMSHSERGEIGIALAAAGHLVAAALRNIKHDIEERLRARLQDRRALDSSF